MGKPVIQQGMHPLIEQKYLQFGVRGRVTALIRLQGFHEGSEHRLLLPYFAVILPLAGQDKKKTSYAHFGIRGDNSRFHSHFSLDRPLSGPNRRPLRPALPDALHAPPPQAPFQPVKGPLCPLAGTLLFPFLALVTSHYISILPGRCQV